MFNTEDLFNNLIMSLSKRLILWSPKKEEYYNNWEIEINKCIMEIKKGFEKGNITKEQLELDLIKHEKISNPNNILFAIRIDWYNGNMTDTYFRESLVRNLPLVSKTLRDFVREIVSYFYNKKDFTGIIEMKSFKKLCAIIEKYH